MRDYYNHLWTGPDTHGSIFWDKVDFTRDVYQYQEGVFRSYIRHLVKDTDTRIKCVLELGAGNGRMTKIMLDELGRLDNYNIMDYINSRTGLIKYDCVDLDCSMHMDKAFKRLGAYGVGACSWLNLDITSKEFDLCFQQYDPNRTYDLILASEVFMHILPEDIDIVIGKLTNLLNDKGSILNIDWFESIRSFDSEWCFMHDYHDIYTTNGLECREEINMPFCKQALFHYGKQ